MQAAGGPAGRQSAPTPTRRRPFLRGLAGGACALITACTPAPPAPAPGPQEPARPALSPESLAISRHFGRVQDELLARGLLRTDGGGPDTPFSARDLAENFERIALYDEYVSRSGRLVAHATESRLRRWEGPVRVAPVFGVSVSESQRSRDTADLARYAARLGALTGRQMRLTHPASADFLVLYVNEDERRAAGPVLRDLVPGIGDLAIDTIATMPRSTFCLVFAFSQGDAPSYARAVAVIRAEHPPLLRLSCLHEELAQGMGLANDSPRARPSIFNDDEEFALLTRHDELLLKMLYDPRLRLGMGAEQARPIIAEIAEELVAAETE